jgi:hypothetical protein
MLKAGRWWRIQELALPLIESVRIKLLFWPVLNVNAGVDYPCSLVTTLPFG